MLESEHNVMEFSVGCHYSESAVLLQLYEPTFNGVFSGWQVLGLMCLVADTLVEYCVLVAHYWVLIA